MSKISLTPNASGTGNFTIASPNSNTDRTLTLPDATGTILTSASSVASSQLPTGSLLQVVNATYGTLVTNNTSTYADTGLTATITPKFATSTILVLVSQQTKKGASNATNGVNIKLFRNSTDLGRRVFVQGYTNTAIENYSMATFQYLDSPATTSATTYKTQFANDFNGNGVSVQADNFGISTITLMEIAA
jgi:hypothetical protein